MSLDIALTKAQQSIPECVAAAWIMDEIKQRVPIWKRERYEDGSESWVECTHRFQM